jgi:Protein of unknown function (DUF3759)
MTVSLFKKSILTSRTMADHFLVPDSDQAQSMQQFRQADNKPELSHELIAGAAAYYAADKYEEHCEANGKDYLLNEVPLPRSTFGILRVGSSPRQNPSRI